MLGGAGFRQINSSSQKSKSFVLQIFVFFPGLSRCFQELDNHRENGGTLWDGTPLNNQPHMHLISWVFFWVPIPLFKRAPTGAVKRGPHHFPFETRIQDVFFFRC